MPKEENSSKSKKGGKISMHTKFRQKLISKKMSKRWKFEQKWKWEKMSQSRKFLKKLWNVRKIFRMWRKILEYQKAALNVYKCTKKIIYGKWKNVSNNFHEWVIWKILRNRLWNCFVTGFISLAQVRWRYGLFTRFSVFQRIFVDTARKVKYQKNEIFWFVLRQKMGRDEGELLGWLSLIKVHSCQRMGPPPQLGTLSLYKLLPRAADVCRPSTLTFNSIHHPRTLCFSSHWLHKATDLYQQINRIPLFPQAGRESRFCRSKIFYGRK